MTRWQPPPSASPSDRGSTHLLLVSTTKGIRLNLDVISPTDFSRPWLISWIRAYIATLPDHGVEDPDFTFVHIVLGDCPDRPPDGRVDGVGVLEMTYGGAGHGPDDGEPTTIAAMLNTAIGVLW